RRAPLGPNGLVGLRVARRPQFKQTSEVLNARSSRQRPGPSVRLYPPPQFVDAGVQVDDDRLVEHFKPHTALEEGAPPDGDHRGRLGRQQSLQRRSLPGAKSTFALVFEDLRDALAGLALDDLIEVDTLFVSDASQRPPHGTLAATHETIQNKRPLHGVRSYARTPLRAK